MASIPLNFITALPSSRNGLIKEVKDEIDILYQGLLMKQNGVRQSVTNKLLVMPLRKLLCDLSKRNDILRKIYPAFRMPKLPDSYLSINVPDENDSVMYFWRSDLNMLSFDFTQTIEDWLCTRLAYIERPPNEQTAVFIADDYNTIISRLSNEEKKRFSSYYESKAICNDGEMLKVFSRIEHGEETIVWLCSMIHKSGYCTTTIQNFIKHYSDKRGAHIDDSIPISYNIVNGEAKNMLTIIEILAYLLAFSIGTQIPELHNECSNVIKKFVEIRSGMEELKEVCPNS